MPSVEDRYIQGKGYHTRLVVFSESDHEQPNRRKKIDIQVIGMGEHYGKVASEQIILYQDCQAEAVLNVSFRLDQQITHEGGRYTLVYTTNKYKLLFSTPNSFVHFDRTEHIGKDDKATWYGTTGVTLDPNTSSNDRTFSITVKIDGMAKTETITFTQPGAPVVTDDAILEVVYKNPQITHEGGSLPNAYLLTANKSVRVTSDSDWLTPVVPYLPVSTLITVECGIIVGENTSTEPRTATLTFTTE